MVLELAVGSVEKKLDMQVSVITGNYEYYYGCGKVAAQRELPVDGETEPEIMKESMDEVLRSWEPEDERMQYLKGILLRYRPAKSWDAQMNELFLMGKES